MIVSLLNFWYDPVMNTHSSTIKSQMTANDVVEFCTELEKQSIEFWLDGGWGVDALLGKQTRPHGDLDLIIQGKDVAALRALFKERDYTLIQRDDTSDLNFKYGDTQGRQVDVIVIVFDEKGNGIYGPIENGEMNPAGSFAGRGTIGDYPVKCVSAEYVIKFRTGYELRDSDYQDMVAVCKKFNIEFPEDHRRMMERFDVTLS